MAAEGAGRVFECGGGPCVNGAATGWPRKAGRPSSTPRRSPSVNGAATGWPRTGDRQGFIPDSVDASMGPRPVGRGRVFNLEKLVTAYERQWGRDRLAAEGPCWRGPIEPCRASMGPRPVGRGRTIFSWGGYQKYLRQWGRDRLAAEGHTARRRPHRAGGVNGAATGWPRKEVLGGGATAALGRVNGAATGWPRKDT